ncbi:Rab-like protein 3 [Lunasporangiospora selenospora]|uniref:Rab-like protein 3 n=1 Tax=Lunasporangiospora selenospora TaxID=979761 RepID=A0A9P6KGM0_9FUNG|nr:Rab-like protein 3 [Lunasporangiospora selenospora]
MDVDNSVRILILGDSGVGKSSLVHILCHNEPLRAPNPTVGCNVDVRLHSNTTPSAPAIASIRSALPSLLYRNNGPADPSISSQQQQQQQQQQSQSLSFIEFYDVSGSPAVRHPKSRSAFYNGVSYHGIILVHDLCNRRSYDNLWRWMSDYMEGLQSVSGSDNYSYTSSGGYFDNGPNVPLMVVGTKKDLAPSYDQSGLATATTNDLATKYDGEAITLCAISLSDFMPNSSTSIAFNLFFNRVVDRNSSSSTSTTTFSRSRMASGQNPVYPNNNNNSISRSPTPTHNTPRAPPTTLSNGQTASSQDHESPIPIMDFATFTGASSPARTSSPFSETRDTPPYGAGRSTTPTGTMPYKSSLRAHHDKNRSTFSQYSNMSVPVFTSNSGGSRS